VTVIHLWTVNHFDKPMVGHPRSVLEELDMADVVRLVEQKEGTKPLQLALFGLNDDPRSPQQTKNLTYTMALWGSAPRFQVYTSPADREAGKYLKTVERDFMFGNRMYHLTVAPARLKRGKSEIEEYPGEREQLIEEVIYKLATQPGRLSIVGDKGVGLTFSLWELRQELNRTGHSLSSNEIKEALIILQSSTIEISRRYDDPDDTGGEIRDTLRTATFTALSFRERSNEKNSQTMVQFNPYVANAVMALDFSLIDYEMCMRLRGLPARLLFRRLTNNVVYFGNDSGVQIFRASEIIRDCGISECKRKRDTLRKITDAVTALKTVGVIDGFTMDDVYVGQAKDDIIFTIHLSDSFMAQTGYALKRRNEIHASYEQVMGEKPKRFKPTTAADHLRLVRIKERQVAEDKTGWSQAVTCETDK
jgi:hypothetical protein